MLLKTGGVNGRERAAPAAGKGRNGACIPGVETLNVLMLNPPADQGVRQVREGRCMQRAGAWTAIWTPLSLAYCAGILRDDGFGVALSDCIIDNTSFQDVRDMVRDFKPNVVILNTATPSIVSDLSTADHIKDIDPDIVVAAIGVHGTALPEDTLKLNRNIDFLIRNEPEQTTLELCRDLRSGGNGRTVRGVSFLQQDALVNNPDQPFIADLDALPYPAYDLIHSERYLLPFSHTRFLLVSTSRGCHFGCRFCMDHVYYGKKMRLRTPAALVDELVHWRDTLGIRDFLFWTESFALDADFCCAVAREIIDRDIGIRWFCNSRADQVDSDMMALFRRAGCNMISFGVESGSQDTLDAMNKNTTIAKVRKAVKAAQSNGIEVVAHTILGFPCESEKTVRATIRYVKKLGVDYAQFYCAVPFPGSPLYDQALENGWIVTDNWKMFEQNFSVLKYPGMDPDKLMKLRRKAYLSFYLRPRIMASVARRTLAHGGINRTVATLKDFLTWV